MSRMRTRSTSRRGRWLRARTRRCSTFGRSARSGRAGFGAERGAPPSETPLGARWRDPGRARVQREAGLPAARRARARAAVRSAGLGARAQGAGVRATAPGVRARAAAPGALARGAILGALARGVGVRATAAVRATAPGVRVRSAVLAVALVVVPVVALAVVPATAAAVAATPTPPAGKDGAAGCRPGSRRASVVSRGGPAPALWVEAACRPPPRWRKPCPRRWQSRRSNGRAAGRRQRLPRFWPLSLLACWAGPGRRPPLLERWRPAPPTCRPTTPPPSPGVRLGPRRAAAAWRPVRAAS